MNQLKKQLLCLAVLVNAMPLTGAENTTTNIVPRSQSFDAPRQMIGWDNSVWGINRKADDDRYYTSFNLTFEYTRTFRNNRLTRALFGDDLVCTGCDNDLGLKISGSTDDARAATDWLGDYFGLPLDYRSTVSFKPQISNYILDFSFYAGLDAWLDGLYFRIHSPFVHTNWNLNAQETASTSASNSVTASLAAAGIVFPAGYFTNETVTTSNGTPNTSFLAYANGATPTFENYLNNYADEDLVWQPLCCSRIINSCDCDGNGLSRNGFGEIRFALGRNYISEREDRDCHVGIGVYAAAPTGTRVGTSRYLFEPIVGNGKHWELGAQITGHHICWTSEDDRKNFGVYVEANITHLFAASQTRCFDLCSAGSGSRYMLAEKLEYFSPTSILGGSPVVTMNATVAPQGLQFANEYAPVANLTRRDITSTIGAQGDLAISFAYKVGNFQWDLGYNFWGRSCEKLRINTDCCPVIPGTWALKGTALVYGFDRSLNIAVPLAATDSTATIHGGANNFVAGAANVNKFIDNNVRAVDTASNNLTAGPLSTLPTYTSNPPVLISETDFNFSGTRGISNKIFTNINWACDHCKNSKWSPYVSLGGEVEFGGGRGGNDCCEIDPCSPCYSYPVVDTCDTLNQCCSNVALTQWGVWFKVGSSYN